MHRSLRSLRPESPALDEVCTMWCLSGACPETPRKVSGVSGSTPEYPATQAGVSGPSGSQRSEIVEGYKYPSTYLSSASSPSLYEP